MTYLVGVLHLNSVVFSDSFHSVRVQPDLEVVDQVKLLVADVGNVVKWCLVFALLTDAGSNILRSHLVVVLSLRGVRDDFLEAWVHLGLPDSNSTVIETNKDGANRITARTSEASNAGQIEVKLCGVHLLINVLRVLRALVVAFEDVAIESLMTSSEGLLLHLTGVSAESLDRTRGERVIQDISDLVNLADI